MICDKLKKWEDTLRKFCCKCDGAKKLVSGHCSATSCEWYDTRKSLIEKSYPISLFNSDSFYSMCLDFLAKHNHEFLSQMYWSDIRLTIEGHLDSIRAKKPTGNQLNWWGHLSTMVHRAGWYKTSQSRISPINRAREFLYVKSINKSVAA